MKWYLFIGSVLVILISGSLFLLWPNTEPAGNTAPDGTLPSTGTVGNVPNQGSTVVDPDDVATMVVASQISGKEVITKDFTHNGSTIKDVQNPDRYFLVGKVGYCLADGTCPSGALSDDYSIVYQSADQSFIIALLTEPLYQARQSAEQYLATTLGISEAEMCTLKYYISTDSYINATYAGKNLLFSFCKGATPLPK